jgi:hypothetical protein
MRCRLRCNHYIITVYRAVATLSLLIKRACFQLVKGQTLFQNA